MGNTSSTHNCNVVFLGLDGSGKTSILARLSGDDPRTVLPTLGFNIRAFSLENAPLLKVWDQGGTPSMRRYWPAYYAKAHAIAFVIDSSDHRRLGECSRVMQEVLDDDLLLGVPLLVLANKQDVPNAIPSGEIEELMHLGSIRDRAWRCIACSALRDKGLYDGLRWLAEASVGARPGGSDGRRARCRRPDFRADVEVAAMCGRCYIFFRCLYPVVFRKGMPWLLLSTVPCYNLIWYMLFRAVVACA